MHRLRSAEMIRYDSSRTSGLLALQPHHYNPLFWTAVFLAQALLFGAVLPLLLVYLLYFRWGIDWNSKIVHPDNPDINNQMLFNVHPLAMVVGFIIVYSQGVLIYRMVPLSKIAVKLVHVGIHFLVLGIAAVGYASVVIFHHKEGLNHLYSLHSWLGIVTGVLFFTQFSFGLTVYLVPYVPVQVRAFFMPFHRFGGIAIFTLSVLTCVSGLQEKVLYGLGQDHSWCKNYTTIGNKQVCILPWSYSDVKSPEGLVVNCLGLAICLAVGIVVFIATRTDWQRRSASESDTVKLLGAN